MNRKSKGKNRVIPVREVFPHEAHDFTVWLEKNIDVLSECIGITLEVEKREKPIGNFRADLVCIDSNGNRVIIENQLERTDNKHLGQIVHYMMNQNAQTAIWITPEPISDHINTVEALNAKQNSGLAIFLLKLEVLQADKSPHFTIVSRPSEQVIPAIDAAETERAIALETMSQPPSKSSNQLPPIWCIFPRRDKATYDHFLRKNCIGLGFGSLGDLGQIAPNLEAFKLAWLKGYSDNPHSAKVLYSILFRFVHGPKIGDVVVYAPTWYERKIHIGKITSDYKFNRFAFLHGYHDIRSVEWISMFRREDFSQEALKGISVNLAFFQIRNPLFVHELSDKLSGGF